MLRQLFPLALAVAVYWVAAWTASKDFPAVADEIAHITGGVSYWRYGIDHLQPENGFVSKHWATLPLLFHPPVFPAVPADLPQNSAMIVMGHRFFYESGNDPAAMLAAGRAMIALFGAALVALIWWWAKRLWGPAGGLLAAGLAAFSPTLLAHGGIVMSDITVSLFLLAALTAYWALLHRVSVPRMLGCGLCLGLLLLSKMSGVLILPMMGALLVVRFLAAEPIAWSLVRPSQPAGGAGKLAVLLGATLGTGLVAGLVLWTAFGFRYSMFANPAAPSLHFDVTWDMLLSDHSVVSRCVAGMRDCHLLPEAWLYGLAYAVHSLPGRPGFLNGQISNDGWLAYFPYVWLVKTPLALFGLMLLGFAAVVGTHRHPPAPRPPGPPGSKGRTQLLYEATPLLALFFIYGIFALRTPINIGHRHLLPLYPSMLVLAGGAACWLREGSRLGRALVAGLAVWFAIESLSIRPYYLAYFNALAGGPSNGYRHLVDSNVDAGQDLIALQRWLDTHAPPRGGQAPPVYLSFFGPADPVAHGIHATRFADNGFDARPRAMPVHVQGGLFCISVTLYQGLYTLAPGPWTAERESLYQRLIAVATKRRPTAAEAVTIEHLQFARLRHFLTARPPNARVGYSILIFRLSDAEIAEAFYAPLPIVERTIARRMAGP